MDMECGRLEGDLGRTPIERATCRCMRIRSLVSALLAMIGCAYVGLSTAQSVSARQMRDNAFELTLTHSAVISEQDAFAHIAHAAKAICRGAAPVLGRYRYAAKEQLGGGALARVAPSFRFVQEVECTRPAAVVQNTTQAATPLNPDEAARMRERGRAETLQFFKLLTEKKFAEALIKLGPGAVPEDGDAWIREKRKFQETAGSSSKVDVLEVTVYENPAGAPKPGIYIAADFQNAYRNVPYECGYLMWHLGDDKKLLVTRSEVGHVTASTLSTIPEAQRPELLKRMRCVHP